MNISTFFFRNLFSFSLDANILFSLSPFAEGLTKKFRHHLNIDNKCSLYCLIRNYGNKSIDYKTKGLNSPLE